MTINDSEKKALEDAGYSGTLPDMVHESLEVSTSSTGTTPDLWKKKFDQEAIPAGVNPQRYLAYLQSLGATSNNINTALKELSDIGIAPSAPQGPAQNPILDTDHPDLVAMYTMDNVSGSTILDESPNGYNGTDTLGAFTAGVIGNCINYGGSGQANFDTDWTTDLAGDFAISGWIRRDTASNGNTHLMFSGLTPNTGNPLIQLYNLNSSTAQLLVRNDAGTLGPVLNCPLTVAEGFQYIVIQRSGSTLEIYKAAVLQDSGTWTPSTTTLERFVLGAGYNDDSGSQAYVGNCDGSYDQTRVFNRALTEDEINTLYFEGVDQVLNTDHPNLTAMYTMDNVSGSTLVDETGVNDGTITGTSQVSGVINNALSFVAQDDTLNNIVTVSDNASLDFGTGDFSCSFWMNAPASANGKSQQVLGKDSFPGFGSSYTGWFIQRNTDNSLVFATRDLVSGAGNQTYMNSGASAISDNTTHHVVAARSSGTLYLYIDGVLVTSQAEAGATDVDNASAFKLGMFDDDPVPFDAPQSFGGWLDQVRLYNRPLTEDEVYTLYIEGVPTLITDATHPATTAKYTMDNITGSTLNDETGTYNGTITSATTTTGVIGDALRFDGVDDWVDLAGPLLPSTGNWAVAAWIKIPDILQNGELLAQVTNRNDTNRLILKYDASPEAKFEIFNTSIRVISTVPVVQDQWYFVVFQRDGELAKISIDGAASDTGAWPSTATIDQAGTTLGARNDNTTGTYEQVSKFYGLDVDQLYVFNRALNDNEISQLYLEGSV